jgi:hypothetical protein
VLDKIEELRPAGVRVIKASAGNVSLQAQLQLTLAGSHMAPAEITQVHRLAQEALVAEVRKKGVGEKIRNRALTAAVLRDERIVDAVITLGVEGSAAGAPGGDFEPDPGVGVQLCPENITFGADTFDQELGAGEKIAVEVRALIAAQPLPGVQLSTVKANLQTRLKALFDKVAVGATIDSGVLLTALRADTEYAIDPLRTQVTLTSADQFVQISQGGPAFTVQPQQVFHIASVEVKP